MYGNLDKKREHYPLMSSTMVDDKHGGLAFHLGVTRTVLFNLLDDVVNTCNDHTSEESLISTSSDTDSIRNAPSL